MHGETIKYNVLVSDGTLTIFYDSVQLHVPGHFTPGECDPTHVS